MKNCREDQVQNERNTPLGYIKYAAISIKLINNQVSKAFAKHVKQTKWLR
jgi:hypothetical protein